jgi:hypothetical protein
LVRVPTVEVASDAIRAALQLQGGGLTIRRFYPESFLITCSTAGLKSILMDRGTVVDHRFVLLFNHWSRNTYVSDLTVASKVHLELEGIPFHAWFERTAEVLLAHYGTIDEVHYDTKCRADLSAYRLSMWTCNPATIPASRWLYIADPSYAPVNDVNAAMAGVTLSRYLIRIKTTTLDATSE